MNSIKILTDSSSDITETTAKRLGIEIVPLYVGFGQDLYLDNIEIKHEEIFDSLIQGKKVNTAAPSPGDFLKRFQKILEADKNTRIICITLSSRLSGSFNAAETARNMLPNAKIEIIDSRTSTLSLGLIAIQAATAINKGYSYKEIKILISRLIDMNRFIAVLGSFEYVFKGGRTAFFGKILSKALVFTPVLTIGKDGKVHLKKFCRNKQFALNYIIEQALNIARDYKKVNIGLFYGLDPVPIADAKKEFDLTEDIRINRFEENKITTVISAHTGPEIWGIAVSPYLL